MLITASLNSVAELLPGISAIWTFGKKRKEIMLGGVGVLSETPMKYHIEVSRLFTKGITEANTRMEMKYKNWRLMIAVIMMGSMFTRGSQCGGKN